MTFEEYKKKKQDKITAFQEYKASKMATSKPTPQPEVKQTVKVSTEKPALPTVKVGTPLAQNVKVFVSPEEERRRALSRISSSPQPKPKDIITLGAGPLSKQTIDKVLDRPVISQGVKQIEAPKVVSPVPVAQKLYEAKQKSILSGTPLEVKESEIKKRIQSLEDARLSYLRQQQKAKTFEEQGVPKVIETEKDKTATREFTDALVRSYYTLIKPTVGTMAETLGTTPEIKQWGREFADKTEAQLFKNPQLLPSQSKNLTNKVANIMGEMIPFMGVVVASSFVGGPVAGFSAGAAMEKSSAYRGYIDAGMPPDKADITSTVYGLVASGLENSFGIKPAMIAGKVMTAETKKIFVKSFLDYVKKELPKVSIKILKNALEEGSEEVLQGIAEQIGLKFFDENANIFEGMAENFIGGAVGGGILGGGGAILNSAVNTKIEKPGIKEPITRPITQPESTTEAKPQEAPIKPQEAITEVLPTKTTIEPFKPKESKIEPVKAEAETTPIVKEVEKAQEKPVEAEIKLDKKLIQRNNIDSEISSVNKEIDKRLTKFRKEADLMAKKEGAGVKLRPVEDAVGNVIFVAKDFSLGKAKADMYRQRVNNERYAHELMYENDAEYKGLIDYRDSLTEKRIEFAETTKEMENIWDEIDREEKLLKDKIQTYEAKQTKTKETPEPQAESTGETKSLKESGVAKIIEAKAIEQKLTKGYENVTKFESKNFKEESQKTAELINSDIETARAIVRGEVETDIRAGAFIAGMEEYAKKHPEQAGEIIQELANSPLSATISEGASETSFARMIEKDSASERLAIAKKAKEKRVVNLKEKKTALKKELKNEVNKFNLSKAERSFDNFLDKITC